LNAILTSAADILSNATVISIVSVSLAATVGMALVKFGIRNITKGFKH
jgi:hypothetical protein